MFGFTVVLLSYHHSISTLLHGRRLNYGIRFIRWPPAGLGEFSLTDPASLVGSPFGAVGDGLVLSTFLVWATLFVEHPISKFCPLKIRYFCRRIRQLKSRYNGSCPQEIQPRAIWIAPNDERNVQRLASENFSNLLREPLLEGVGHQCSF